MTQNNTERLDAIEKLDLIIFPISEKTKQLDTDVIQHDDPRKLKVAVLAGDGTRFLGAVRWAIDQATNYSKDGR